MARWEDALLEFGKLHKFDWRLSALRRGEWDSWEETFVGFTYGSNAGRGGAQEADFAAEGSANGGVQVEDP